MAADGFTYDAFISYSSKDRAWAERVYRGLTDKGLDVFLDSERLRGGDDWRGRLVKEVRGSRTFVLLWSEAGDGSQWVSQELGRFQGLMESDAAEGRTARRLIQVALGHEFKPIDHFQSIREIKPAEIYTAGPDALPAGTWTGVIGKLEAAISDTDDALRIPLLLLASTRDRMAEVDPAKKPPGTAASMSALLGELDLGGTDDVLQCYGERRLDWQPFGAGVAIREVLDGIQNELNLKLKQARQRRVRFMPLDEEAFWDADDAAALEVAKLEGTPSLIVVDPLSLYDELVLHRYSNFVQTRLVGSAETFVLVLAPFTLPSPSASMRSAIRSMARQLFEHYYEPPIFKGVEFARCGANVGDAMELKAWLLNTIGATVVRGSEASRPAVLRTD